MSKFKKGDLVKFTIEDCDFYEGTWTGNVVHILSNGYIIQRAGDDFSFYIAPDNIELIGDTVETKIPIAPSSIGTDADPQLTWNKALDDRIKGESRENATKPQIREPKYEFPNIEDRLPNPANDMPTSHTGAAREKLNEIPYDLIPYYEITMSYRRVAEFGAKKYDAWNWTKGLARVQILCSLLNHTFAYLRGKEIDDGPKGSGLSHADHILWNAVALVHNVHHGLEDGRRIEPPRDYNRNET